LSADDDDGQSCRERGGKDRVFHAADYRSKRVFRLWTLDFRQTLAIKHVPKV
jgi:hypothetical protein